MKYPLSFYKEELDFLNKRIKRSRAEDTLKRLDIRKKYILEIIKKKQNNTKKDKLYKMEKKRII